MRKRVGAVLVVVLVAACSDEGPNNEAACAAVEDYFVASQGIDLNDSESLGSGLGEAAEAKAVFIENAPQYVGEALVKMDELASGTSRTEQENYLEAQETANGWLREECGLDGGF